MYYKNDYFIYNSNTGILYWRYGKRKHKRVGYITNGYLSVKYGGRKGTFDYVHRIICKMVHVNLEFSDIDHIDGDTLNNKLNNLRNVPHKINSKNRKKSLNNMSEVVGVSFDTSRNKWIVYIKYNYKNIFLGRFDSKEEAIQKRKKAEIEYGFHKNHGRDI